MRPIYFNGKFYAGGFNGVHRVADRLIREVDRLLADMPAGERPQARLLAPTRRSWQPELCAIELVEEPKGHSQAWEQFILPRRAADGVLVNLCNLAPLLHRRKLLLLHDAQFAFAMSSYPLRQQLGYRVATPWMARSSSRVLTVSEYSRQMLDLVGVSASHRTSVLSNGADHMLETAADAGVLGRLGVARPFVVHIASPKAYKNSAVIFRAFEDARLDDVDLVLVGPDRPSLEAAGLSPPARAVFAGRVDDGELRGLYEAALCLAFPSRTEGYGLPPVEAMTCGCPAVVAPGGAIPEVCADAVLYADVDAPQAWVSAIRRLLDEPALRPRKVAEGLTRAETFTWAASGRSLADHILQLARE